MDEIGLAVQNQLRRANAASAELDSSSDEGDASRQHLRVRSSRDSCRNSATGSVSGKHPRASHGIRGTPQLPVSASPQFSAAAATASPPPESTAPADSFYPAQIPVPSSIDLLSSAQAQARLLWAWETQMEHQFRLYTLLEYALKKPFLLNIHYCIVQLSVQIQLQLTKHYYSFDPAFVRHLMGQKLSTKTRGTIESILEKVRRRKSAMQPP